MGLPDIKGREEILKVHSRHKPLGEDVSLRDVARATAGFTGADLENLMNEAALLAARRKARFITAADLQEATIKVVAGPEKKSRVVHRAGQAPHRLSRGGPRHHHPRHEDPGFRCIRSPLSPGARQAA